MCDSMHETAATPSVSLATVAMCVCVLKNYQVCISTGKGIPCFGRIRFADLTLKPRLAEHPDRQTVSFFFLHVAITNSLRSNNGYTLQFNCKGGGEGARGHVITYHGTRGRLFFVVVVFAVKVLVLGIVCGIDILIAVTHVYLCKYTGMEATAAGNVMPV